MNISSDLFSSTITPPSAPLPPAREGEGGILPSHVPATEKLGSALPDNARDSLFAGARKLQESGGSFEEVKAFIENELETNAGEVTNDGQRSGLLVDMFA